MVLQANTVIETAPKLFSIDDAHSFRDWIAEGTDGYLYKVPSEPGGWSKRDKYEGQTDDLKPLSPQKARAIVQFVAGHSKDWGPVTIAEASPSEQQDYWNAPQDSV